MFQFITNQRETVCFLTVAQRYSLFRPTDGRCQIGFVPFIELGQFHMGGHVVKGGSGDLLPGRDGSTRVPPQQPLFFPNSQDEWPIHLQSGRRSSSGRR